MVTRKKTMSLEQLEKTFNYFLISERTEYEFIYKRRSIQLTKDVLEFIKNQSMITLKTIGTGYDYDKKKSKPMYSDSIIFKK